MKRRKRQRFLAPEVVQTSAMDCGPAALKCLLAGFGIRASYGRLREACHTEVDGTSIDTLEEVAVRLGLEAEQRIVPVDDLCVLQADALPSIVVMRMPGGLTHFVVAWRTVGPLVQVMDPAFGRRWLPRRQFLEDVYVHEMDIPADDWRTWAEAPDFREPLIGRLRGLGLGREATRRVDEALATGGWREIATLDAASRLVASLRSSRALPRGRCARAVLEALVARGGESIPARYWSARPVGEGGSSESSSESSDGPELVRVRGAVILRGLGRRVPEERDVTDEPLGPELTAALREDTPHPARELWAMLRGDGVFSWAVLATGLVLVAAALVLEAVLLRGVLDVGAELGLVTQRLEALGVFAVFALAFLLLELKVAEGLARLGRRLEVMLRAAFLEKLPRLSDRYFQSRPTSDMAERCHSAHSLRELPGLGGRLVRAVLGLALTAGAIGWVDPPSAPYAALAALLAIALPLVFLPKLTEADLRMRTHTGALTRFYLDALLGLAALRAHTAESAVRCEHENLLAQWNGAGERVLRTGVTLECIQSLCGIGLAVCMLGLYAGRASDPAAALLLAYWVLQMPVLGHEVTQLVRQYPILHNKTLRLLEPLGAPESVEVCRDQPTRHSEAAAAGAAIRLTSVSVVASGNRILHDVDLDLEPGSHVGIVGPSGAGKSTLIGLLLGWYRAETGRVEVDGLPLDTGALARLRRQTVWVGPSVRLWNQSMLQNLHYGTSGADRAAVADVLEQADLLEVLMRLPEGMQSPLGEGGGLLSGGEGQRVRLGRGLTRPGVRLVLLDEPFRGLDSHTRRRLWQRVRKVWRDATILVVTHDVQAVEELDRVVVLEGGRIVEDGRPEVLRDNSSRFGSLLREHEAVRRVWSNGDWRRLQLVHGRLEEQASGRSP